MIDIDSLPILTPTVFLIYAGSLAILILWICLSSRPYGAFGVLALALLPVSLYMVWPGTPGWVKTVTVMLTLLCFAAGMLAPIKSSYGLWHCLALVVSLFGKPAMARLFGGPDINLPPVGWLVLLGLLAVGGYSWRSQRDKKPKTKRFQRI